MCSLDNRKTKREKFEQKFNSTMKAPESYFEHHGLIEGQKSPAKMKMTMQNIDEKTP